MDSKWLNEWENRDTKNNNLYMYEIDGVTGLYDFGNGTSLCYTYVKQTNKHTKKDIEVHDKFYNAWKNKKIFDVYREQYTLKYGRDVVSVIKMYLGISNKQVKEFSHWDDFYTKFKQSY